MDDTTNPGEGSEVVDALASGNENLDPIADNQDFDDTDLNGLDGIEGDEDGEGGDAEATTDALEEVEFEGKTFNVPKEIKDGLLRHADYTRKTQEVAEIRKTVEARQSAVQQTEQLQAAFAQDIAHLGALNDRLAPYEKVQDWPTYLRTGGAEAQAHYAEMQALRGERDAFAQGLGQKVQQRQAEEQRETAKLIEAGRAELAKHIKGYGPDTLSKLETFAAPFGFSSDEIRQAEADPRSIRILHLAQIGQQALQAQRKTRQIAQGQQTSPVQTLRGSGGAGNTAPERMSPSEMAKHLGLRA